MTADLTLHFPHGLPGFETSQQFVLRSQTPFAPVACLQSTDAPDLCFLVVPIVAILNDYSLRITAEDLNTLGFAAENEEALCLAILTVPQEGSLTANLLAPIVVNLKTNIAVQAVRADRIYSHQHAVSTLRPVAAAPEVAC